MRDNNGNFQQQVGASSEHFAVFLDPESMIYYRMHLNSPTCIKIEHYVDPQAAKEDQLSKRDASVRKNMRLLLDLPKFHWEFHGADFFRRRLFPLKFLQNECSKYPCYVFQSPLSKAFNHEKFIDTVVDVSQLSPGARPIEHSEELVTSTSEFIENIHRLAQQRGRINIRAAEGHVLILKTAGAREYFEGNY